MKNNTILVVVITAVIAGGLGFLGGTKLQQNKTQNNFRQLAGQRTGNVAPNSQARTGNRMGFSPVSGEIINFDDKSITVKMTDGGSKIVILSEKTSINKSDIATITDLKIGEKVAVFGTDNTDGSVTAQSVQLNPVEQVKRNISETPTPRQ
jgi:ribosomal protein S1